MIPNRVKATKTMNPANPPNATIKIVQIFIEIDKIPIELIAQSKSNPNMLLNTSLNKNFAKFRRMKITTIKNNTESICNSIKD